MIARCQEAEVLSIQSHVVSGYVGNKSAIFPLQVLGFEVHPINSVQFSNHTGYGSWTGTVMESDELADLMRGLEANRLDRFSHILTGYVGASSFLEQVHLTVERLKAKNPDTIYVCDPVLGDNGQLYVPKELVAIYRDRLVPLADIITPNQFEAELLTGQKIESEADALECMKTLHRMGAKTVVISSSDLPSSHGQLAAFGSTTVPQQGATASEPRAWRIDIPRLPHQFTGTGDLFAALLLAWMHRCRGDLAAAMERSLDTLQAVLHTTVERAQQADGDGDGDAEASASRRLELRLVQSRPHIQEPPPTFRAVVLSP